MINQVVLVGRLTKDIDLKYTASGTAVGSFILAVNRNFTDQNGEKKSDFVALLVSAWIEICSTILTRITDMVALLVSAWIEITLPMCAF